MTTRRCRVLAGAMFCLYACTSPAADDGDSTRERMHEIYEAISYLLPVAFDGERFADPGERDAVLERLQSLAAAADELERHAADRGPGFEAPARYLATVARELPLHYRYVCVPSAFSSRIGR